eukprot:Gb_38419 [translate_table: standard]
MEESGRMEGWLYPIHSNRLRLRKRYFVLEGNTLSCFKNLASSKHEEPIKTGLIDSCIRVRDNGRESILRRVFFIFTLYNSSNHDDQLKLGARSAEEAARWMHFFKEAALQAQPSLEFGVPIPSKRMHSFRSGSKRGSVLDRCSSDLLDWTGRLSLRDGHSTADVIATSPWCLSGCENGLRLFKETTDGEFKRKRWDDHPAVMAVGVVDATCESVFETIMDLGPSRSEWDFCFLRGKVVEHLDGHTDIVHKQFHSSCLPFVGMKPRDLLVHRYWRREDDGSYVILYHSVTHMKCPPCMGFVRACLKSGGYVISPLSHPKQPVRSVVKHMLAVDWKFWQSYLHPSRARRITLRMLERIAAMREMFKAKPEGYICADLSSSDQGNENTAILMEEQHMNSDIRFSADQEKTVDCMGNQGLFLHWSDAADEFFDVPEVASGESSAIDFDQSLKQYPETDGFSDEELKVETQPGGHHKLSTAAVFVRRLHELAVGAQKRSQVDIHEEKKDEDILSYEGTLPKNSSCTLPCSWNMADPATFLIRGKHYLQDRQKFKANEPLMHMVAADWIQSDKREDDLAGRPGSFIQRKAAQGEGEFFFIVNIQVPGSTTYSLALYYMMDCPVEGFPLLDKFVKGDDSFRNSRFKLIPYISKGSWIVKQSVGKTACLVGQALEINYFSGKNYLELDINIGSSSVAKGVVNLVLGYLSKLVIEMAFLIQANTEDELPEFLLGTCRLNHLDVSESVPAQQRYG